MYLLGKVVICLSESIYNAKNDEYPEAAIFVDNYEQIDEDEVRGLMSLYTSKDKEKLLFQFPLTTVFEGDAEEALLLAVQGNTYPEMTLEEDTDGSSS